MDSGVSENNLFLPELINMMGPLLSGTLFPYNNNTEKANANALFNSIKEKSKVLTNCFSSAPSCHVNNFLMSFEDENPQIYLDNKQFVLSFNKRDDPNSWLSSDNNSNCSSKKHILISDLIKEIQDDDNHWLGEVLHLESKRIQNRVNECKMRYGAILNFLIANSSAIPILVKNKNRKINALNTCKNAYQSEYCYKLEK
ncbi:uncharacterized protein cubi_01776 [Cryptosporidium ubiquitum]|uniref:Uncharacterized protein n=1 Tax=Cryptosporidium ubiquitum TaxID=857276 RepID=A0A1J4MEK9_9CRYT|nr:uncharacterized protein cubi_01776 [Cryptosporidium ubiquitum]OII71301.1 hypothetical protein cubi_01776 [Cryptosporidium ubiquitum]